METRETRPATDLPKQLSIRNDARLLLASPLGRRLGLAAKRKSKNPRETLVFDMFVKC
ncbi:hypothetical protein [aff. Roholtiella sp. LEGE 12411]|uniref:hypothetical protein n=1 Tax=aff. Roholtiella sp. LEGE 12411 TaxID=1828822 RepID=UPI0018805C1E|nr:hypothetical protein [aff. Roholtiella sp. LEGE 12411]MBE9034714.1 hypothetical protein [aff. Roholtiella sp. LEGE 12411]